MLSKRVESHFTPTKVSGGIWKWFKVYKTLLRSPELSRSRFAEVILAVRCIYSWPR